MDDHQVFKLLPQLAHARGIIPKTVVRPKSGFWFHRVINLVLNLVYPNSMKDSYLHRYWTTVGFSVAYPAGSPANDPEILAHELQHVRQAARWTRPGFWYLYLWPVSQGLLLLATAWLPLLWASGWHLLPWIGGWVVVAGLHLIPQLPDPCRRHWELQAYAINLYFHSRRRPGDLRLLEHVVENLHSMAYYITDPRRDRLKRDLLDIVAGICRRTHWVWDDPIVQLVEELRAKKGPQALDS